MKNLTRAAIVGGGVIGGGWAARLVLNGVDVKVFDPDPHAKIKFDAILANAEHAFSKIAGDVAPPRGALVFSESLADAVADVQLIQESAPERLELKVALLADIDRHAPADALIGSSTSGLRPSDLQAEMGKPERFFVAHPYNPVYLIPLVELVGGGKTNLESIERAKEAYRQLGMKPVVIRKEIDAFVGDRLLEAVWREALWLVRDDVTTVEELDDVIRYSFGLRWAQMGLFMTYRLAGGEAGMRHFIEQFGPTLSWPWTRLMDVPELDEALIDKITEQSDEQASGRSIRELERIRDDNLVGMMQALGEHDGGAGWGAGQNLREFQQMLRDRAAERDGLPQKDKSPNIEG
jgi:carnitine 3-dehydrogenase